MFIKRCWCGLGCCGVKVERVRDSDSRTAHRCVEELRQVSSTNLSWPIKQSNRF